jgi:tripartite-type tricarboxylate transporter receptor subunit TctC
MRRRTAAFSLVAAALPALLHGRGASAQGAWPNRSITLVAPYPPGAVTDLVARVLQQHLREPLGQSIVVENRAGAGGITGTSQVARARPDGYTFLITVNPPIVTSPFIARNLAHSPARDLTGVTMVGETYIVLAVRPESPFRTVAEIVAEAKRRPGELSFGSAGVGSAHHVAGELMAVLGGARLNHIPYGGGAPAVQAAVAGQLDMTFGTLPAILPFAQRGELRIIAAAEPKRIPTMPDLPTIAETIPGVETTTWLGTFAPTGTPTEILGRMHAATVEAVNNPQAQAALVAGGFVPVLEGPAEFNRRIATDLQFWEEAIKRIGLQPQ